MSQAFSRVNAFIVEMMSLIEQWGPVIGRQMAGSYKSRGKGRMSKPGKNYRGSVNSYPFSSKRQDERIRRTQEMVVVNGFELMQTVPAWRRNDHLSDLNKQVA